MDPVLARMFDLDRPMAERVEERTLRDDFVKSASELGLDLASMPDSDVNALYGRHLALYFEKKAQFVKQAELVRIGRLLARQMFKQAQPRGIPISELDPETVQYLWGHAGTPQGAPFQNILHKSIKEAPLELAESLAARGVPVKDIRTMMEAAGVDPEVVRAATGLKSTAAARFAAEGVKHRAAWTARAPGSFAASPELMTRLYNVGQITPEMAAIPPSGWSKWGPQGLLKALSAGDLPTVGRKLLPIGGVALGLGYLLKRRNEEKERQLASMGLMGGGGGAGIIPAVGV